MSFQEAEMAERIRRTTFKIGRKGGNEEELTLDVPEKRRAVRNAKVELYKPNKNNQAKEYINPNLSMNLNFGEAESWTIDPSCSL
jgi:hypothetical protein